MDYAGAVCGIIVLLFDIQGEFYMTKVMFGDEMRRLVDAVGEVVYYLTLK